MDYLTPTLPAIKWMQQFHFLLHPMQFFSILGTELCYLALLPIIYWAVSRRLGARLGALLLFSVIVNEIVKVGFACPRPYWIQPALLLGNGEPSFGFPSGHAQNAWLLWPFLALYARNRKLWIPLSCVLALCITISRNYLGVHFPADSIGGTLIGLSILGLARLGGPSWMRFWRQLSSLQKIVIAVFATLFLAAIYAMAMYKGVYGQISGYSNVVGKEYETAIQNAMSGGVIASRLGGFCGLIVGAALLARRPEFEARVPLHILAPRLAIGFVGLIVCYSGLKLALPNGIGWNFARYFATTLWVTFGAPWVFGKIKSQKRRVV
ncbi:PAP2 superfamily protein [Abditibacterium utsteinense]|uniref:PAP2 superfamily protein n=2 Tax=Abditibacterium utsteinense TaxID=1960156 RepID=A0A2S8STD7_9BACT|nr:phosphatase PAP2 family protein [Abditibacterium utsteinense]PQV64060.1 PAP2 superfamily protein [Abditibacterium utsteinense]